MDDNRNITRGTSRRGGSKTKIVIERIYLGKQDMEEAFRPINEDNAMRNIRALAQKANEHDSEQSA